MEADALLYTQWFQGKQNVVADSLSRDLYYLPPHAHKQFLQMSTYKQLPNNFQIQPLPDKICSFITYVLQLMPVQAPRLIQPSPSKLARGRIGVLSSIALGSRTQSSLKDATPSNVTSSCLPSHKQCETEHTLEEIVDHWWKEQSSPPSHLWLRPSGQATGLTPDWTVTENNVSSSHNSGEHTETWTSPDGSRKHYQ